MWKKAAQRVSHEINCSRNGRKKNGRTIKRPLPYGAAKDLTQNGGESIELQPCVRMKSTLTYTPDDIFRKRGYYTNNKNIFSKSGHDNRGLYILYL